MMKWNRKALGAALMLPLLFLGLESSQASLPPEVIQALTVPDQQPRGGQWRGVVPLHPDRVSVRGVDGTLNELELLIDGQLVRRFQGPAFRGYDVIEEYLSRFNRTLEKARRRHRKVNVDFDHPVAIANHGDEQLIEMTGLGTLSEDRMLLEIERLQNENAELRARCGSACGAH